MQRISDNRKYFSELLEYQENFTFDSSSFKVQEAALVLTLWQVFCYNATKIHLFVRGTQWITSSLIVHSMLYLKSLKLGWEVETNYMKTVIWVLFLVQCSTEPFDFSSEYVVNVHVSWMLKYLNNSIIVYCRTQPLPNHALHILTPTLFFLNLVYFVFLNPIKNEKRKKKASYSVWPNVEMLSDLLNIENLE